jgi:hypothetical protein
MWKRVAGLIAAVAFAVSIVACTGGGPPEAKKTPAKTKTPATTKAPAPTKAPDAPTTPPA